MKKQSIKAFTLVELAVVMVVIALIIVGIMQAREMIESSKHNRIIKEVNEIKAAMNNFRLKYNSLPGDLDNAETIWGSSNATNGDGDGDIDKTVTGMGESLYVWQHLNLANVYPGNFSGALSSGELAVGTNVPGSKYSKAAGYTFYDRASATTYSVYTKLGNVLEFGGCDNNQTNFIYCSGPILKAESAESIDSKMDDGNADSGFVMGTDGYSAVSTRVSGCADDYTASSASYDIDNKTIACRLFFWLEEPEN